MLSAWFLFIPHPGAAPFVKPLARAAQKTAAPLDSIGFDDPISTTDRLLESLAAGIPDTITNVRRRAEVLEGIETTIEFFRARSSPDPGEYIDWAESQGLRMVDEFPTKPPATNIDWNKAYRFCTGRSPENPLTPDSLFRAYYHQQSTVHDGALRPVGLVSDPRGVEIEITEFTHFADNFDAYPPIKGDGFDMDFWYGGSSMGAIQFFQPERDLRQILEEYDSTLAMRIKIISVGATGVRTPTLMILYRDPRDGRWRIQDIHIQNVTWDSGLGLRKMRPPIY